MEMSRGGKILIKILLTALLAKIIVLHIISGSDWHRSGIRFIISQSLSILG